MNFHKEELHIISLLSKGYVLHINEHNEEIIQNLLKKNFEQDKKKIKLIKNYSIELTDVFCATVDSRFKVVDL